jgi:hypothetical protein
VADPTHVKRLKQDVAEWNAWRLNNISKTPDLSDADLRDAKLDGADLIHADLRGADLRGANLRDPGALVIGDGGARLIWARLSGANLRGINLRGAHLSDADLSRADLSDADLIAADLSDANLFGANLSNATLVGADLSRADLRRANFTKAELGETILGDVDLTSIIGLETCIHGGPSTIDHRTLQKSGSLPLAFLRGVGLAEHLIDYLPSLLNQAIQHYSCFISYSTKDQEFADRLHADLQNKGIRCWLASHDLPIGGKILDAVDEAIRLRDKMVLILSKHSIKSNWVEKEVKKALEEEDVRKPKQTVLFPIRLDDVVMKTKEAWAGLVRRDRNIGDFRQWKDHDAYKQSLERVVRDLTIKQPPKPQVP